MAKDTKEQESSFDILDQVKKVEKAIKAKVLIKKIGELKKIAKEVNELKEEMVATLEELGLSDKDIKRVIDFINELPDVKLTDREKKEIRETAQADVEETKAKEESEVEKMDITKLIGLSNMPTGNFVNAIGQYHPNNDKVWAKGNDFGNGVLMATAGMTYNYAESLNGDSQFTLTCSNGKDSVNVKL